MPLYQIDVEKRFGEEYWTNVYYVEAADLAEANTIAGKIGGQEANIHFGYVTFTKARIRTAAAGDEIYVTRPFNFVGTADPNGGALLPLFNTIRVDFAAISGRPSRKFYRGCLVAANVAHHGKIVEAHAAAVEAKVDAFFEEGLAQVPLRDVDGQELLSASVARDIAMRQLRRGTKRKLQPILPD